MDTQTKTLYLVMHHDDYRMSSSFFDPGTVVLYKNKKAYDAFLLHAPDPKVLKPFSEGE